MVGHIIDNQIFSIDFINLILLIDYFENSTRGLLLYCCLYNITHHDNNIVHHYYFVYEVLILCL